MIAKRPRAKRAVAQRPRAKRPQADAKHLVLPSDEQEVDSDTVKSLKDPYNESGVEMEDDEDFDGMSFDSIEKRIEQMCEDTGTPTPLVFLKTVMDGKDPRRNSNIFRHLLVIEQMYGLGEAPPSGSYEWTELVEMIKMDYQQAPVTLQESQQAAKQVAEYMHSKKRNVQVQAKVTHVDITDLTPREVRTFQAKFNNKY